MAPAKNIDHIQFNRINNDTYDLIVKTFPPKPARKFTVQCKVDQSPLVVKSKAFDIAVAFNCSNSTHYYAIDVP